ncbi:MAG TPA: hypothetical protein VK742_20285 [Candidatus Sulfotelmatobacter sp.]|jgi:hypothetical protein|nr:hypothetical protein [Candidatus Sulfotelmatobacter sp.]
MISDLTTTNGGAIVPRETSVLAGLGLAAAVQPVANVSQYLATRDARPHYLGEEHLLITLPAKLQGELKALVRAVHYVAGLVKDQFSVQAACKQALAVYKTWNWKLATFRQKYDAWAKVRDWVVLVNCAKAPACWRSFRMGTAGLPEEFLKLVEIRFGQYKRNDGKKQALLSLKRQWKTGRDEQGNEAVIAGYEAGWKNRNREIFPVGWSYDNILRQIKGRGRFTPAVRALLHEGESAARSLLPGVLGKKGDLRFLEIVTFDDVKLDWLVFNEATGEAEDLWLLVARDRATGLILGYVKHPATIDEEGKASHLGAQQMKELAAQLLETYPLPPYLVHWIVERGTATLEEAVKLALGELFNNRIKVHYTSMIGDSMKGDFRNASRPRGYKEKAKGNSGGKGDHEAGNRLLHTRGSFLPGQTGAHYSIRPAELNSCIKECKEIWKMRNRLPEHKRGDVKYPLTVLHGESDKYIRQFCLDQNFRTEHDIEGFGKVLEWLDADGKRQPSHTAPHPLPPGAQWLKPRMQMPVERAAELIRAVPADQWTRCSPDIIKTFLEHNERVEYVTAKGQIKIDIDGEAKTFCHAGDPLAPGTKVLCYFHRNDPQFLHLTSGDGRILGTWYQVGRTAYLDREALAEALRYTHAARAAATAVAMELAAPERTGLDALRAHNDELKKFIVVTDAPGAVGTLNGNAVSAGLASIKPTAKANQQNPPALEPEPDCLQDILSEDDV